MLGCFCVAWCTKQRRRTSFRDAQLLLCHQVHQPAEEAASGGPAGGPSRPHPSFLRSLCPHAPQTAATGRVSCAHTQLR